MGVLGIPINSRVFAQAEPEGSVFVRPTDWLPITQLVSDGDEKVVFLCAIFDQPTNVISMRISGDYTVDWGDGSATEDFSAGTLSSKDISFASVSATTNATTTEGEIFRQVIVTVTPQAGASLTSLDFSELPATATGVDDWLNPLLDIKISGSSISSLDFNGSERSCFELAILDFIGPNSISSFTNFLQDGSLKEIKNLDTSSGTSFREFLQDNYLTSVPLFDTSSGTDFEGFLQGNNLTSVPLFDTSSGTNFKDFLQSNHLTSVPLFDTSSGTNFRGFLQHNNLTSVPLFDTSSGTDFEGFLQDNNLTSVPLFDTGSGVDFESFLLGNNLTSVPLFDTSSGTDFEDFLLGNNLTSVPLFDTSSGTNFESFLQGNNLTSVPLFDTSSGTNFEECLQDNNLTSVPLFDTSSGTNFEGFLRHNNLTSVPLFDISSGTNLRDFLRDNLIYRIKAGTFNDSLELLFFPRLSRPALVEIFNNLADRSSTSSLEIDIRDTNGASSLSAAERQIATDKNWTIRG